MKTKIFILFTIVFFANSFLYSQVNGEKSKDKTDQMVVDPPSPPKPPKAATAPPPPPPPPAPEVMEEEVFVVVEEQPRFPGCEDKETKEEKDQCAQEKFTKYIGENLVYPETAEKMGIEGKVVVSFIVTKSGKIKNIEVLQSIGSGTDEAAVNVVESMNDLEPWTPGKQRGKAVNVKYTLPITFQLPKKKK